MSSRRSPSKTPGSTPGSSDDRPHAGGVHRAREPQVYGPQTNDLALQLRKRGIDKVILAGMSANLCTESHMRQLIEDGFDVTVVKDATAAAQHPELGDGYAAACVNFAFIASDVVTTQEAVVVINP